MIYIVMVFRLAQLGILAGFSGRKGRLLGLWSPTIRFLGFMSLSRCKRESFRWRVAPCSTDRLHLFHACSLTYAEIV